MSAEYMFCIQASGPIAPSAASATRVERCEKAGFEEKVPTISVITPAAKTRIPA